MLRSPSFNTALQAHKNAVHGNRGQHLYFEGPRLFNPLNGTHFVYGYKVENLKMVSIVDAERIALERDVRWFLELHLTQHRVCCV